MQYAVAATITTDFTLPSSATVSVATGEINLATATSPTPFTSIVAGTGVSIFVYKNCKTWCLGKADITGNTATISNINDGSNIACFKTGDNVNVSCVFVGEELAETAMLDKYQYYLRLVPGC
jgi:ethanolamine utilization protein EutA (predicted chaperonin)